MKPELEEAPGGGLMRSVGKRPRHGGLAATLKTLHAVLYRKGLQAFHAVFRPRLASERAAASGKPDLEGASGSRPAAPVDKPLGHKASTAALKALHAALRQEGLPAFQAAFESTLAGKRAVITWRATAQTARILRSLAAHEAVEPAAELTAWILAQRKLTIPPDHLAQMARRLVALGAVEATEKRLNRRTKQKPAILLLLGLCRIMQGEQLPGVRLVEQALATGLPESLQGLAESERAASYFHRIGPQRQEADSVLALIEPLARPELLRRVLDKDEVDSLWVCGNTHVVLHGVDGLDASIVARRVTPLPYRIFQGAVTRRAAIFFSERLLRLAIERLDGLSSLRSVTEEELEGFRSTLQVRFKSPMAFVYNALEAIWSTDAKRIFLIANGGWFATPLAERLVSEGTREVQIASGSPKDHLRRSIGEALGSVDPLPSLKAISGSTNTENAGGSAIGEQLIGPPLVDLNSPSPAKTGARRCIVCASFRANAGMSLAMPLQDIVQRLLPDWEPLILIIGNGRKDRDTVLDCLRMELGPLLPGLRVKMFSSLSAFGKISLPPRVAGAIDALLLDPEVDDIEIDGLRLSAMLRRQSLRFFGELTQVTATAPDLEELLRAWSPEVILTPQHPALEWKFLQMAARRLDIPTLGVQLYALNRDPWRPALDVDHFLCFDRYSREAIQETTGFPPQRVSPIGSVRWDTLIARARGFDRTTERECLDLAEHQKLVVLATQPLDLEDNRDLVDLALEALDEVPEARLVVKLHPTESDERLAALEQQVQRSPLAQRVLVTKQYDTYRLLAAADLVVNVFSNVGVEAAILDLDVVAVEIGHDFDMFSLGTLGVVEPARCRESAIAQIRGLLTDPERRAAARALRNAYFERNPELRDGRAIERLITALEEAAAAGRAGTWAKQYRLASAETAPVP